MWGCPRCGYESAADELRFCGRCGEARVAGEPASRPARKFEEPHHGGYFAFRRMISPALIRLLHFFGLLLFTGLGSYYLYRSYLEAFTNPGILGAGLVLLIGGNLLWRLLCETLILFFSMHEVLVSIDARLSRE